MKTTCDNDTWMYLQLNCYMHTTTKNEDEIFVPLLNYIFQQSLLHTVV